MSPQEQSPALAALFPREPAPVVEAVVLVSTLSTGSSSANPSVPGVHIEQEAIAWMAAMAPKLFTPCLKTGDLCYIRSFTA
jgi:hypothetical protein